MEPANKNNNGNETDLSTYQPHIESATPITAQPTMQLTTQGQATPQQAANSQQVLQPQGQLQPQPPFQPNPYGYPSNPYFNQQMPYNMPPMGMGYQMPMMQYPFGNMNPNQKKKVGIFGGFVIPAIIFMAIVASSFYGYRYMKTTSTTQISKAQITNDIAKEKTETKDENQTASAPDETTPATSASSETNTETTIISTDTKPSKPKKIAR